MDGSVIARSTAYAIVHRVIDAINQTRELDGVWPTGVDAVDQCEMYRQRSSHRVISMCVGAMDGLFVHHATVFEEARQPSRLLQRAQERLRHELSGVFDRFTVGESL